MLGNLTRLKINLLILFLISINFRVVSQNLDSIKVSDEYFNFLKLDAVLNQLSSKYNVTIIYDTLEAKKHYFTYTFSKGTPIKKVFEIVVRGSSLIPTIDENNVVHIQKKEITKTSESKSVNSKTKEKPTAFNISISGIIKDAANGEALPFALVSVRGTNNAVQTNVDGYFTLNKVPTDTSAIQINYIGFKTTNIYLNPTLLKNPLVIELVAQNILNEVVVEAEREDVMQVNSESVGTLKMSPKQLSKLPNIGERDIMRSFQLMPGVSAANESSSGLYVLGGTPDQNLVLFDGFTVYQVDHLYGFFSAFNYNALKDVQLYKGGYESKYGGRLSSVTEITGKEGNQKNFNVGGDISLLSANAYVEGPIGKKVTFLVAGRRSYKGFLYNEIFNKFNRGGRSFGAGGSGGGRGGGNQTTTVSSYFYDLNTKVTFKPTSRDIISLSIYNGTDYLNNGSSFSLRSSTTGQNSSFSISDLTRYGNVGSSLKWSRRYSDKFYGNTLISFSNFYSKRDRSNQGSIVQANGEVKTFSSGLIETNNLKDYSFKSDYQWDYHKNNQLQFGVSATYYDISYTYSQNDTIKILDKKNYGAVTSAYVQNRLKLFKDKLQLLPGIRANYFSVTQKEYYEPRFQAVFKATSKLTFKAATGLYYQFANQITREDILSGNKTFWLLSDGKKVPVSSAIHYISAVSYETKGFLYSVEGWYKSLSDLTQYTLRFNPSPQGTSYTENFFNGIGNTKGVSFLLQKKFGKFNGWASYTLSQTMAKYLVYRPDFYPADNDVTNEFKIILMYKYKRFDFSTTWVYASGRPYTAPSGAYHVTLLDGTTNDFFTTTSKNNLRLPDYHRMDIAVNYRFISKESGNEIGGLGFSIFNVYNRTNTWYKTFQISDNQIIQNNISYLGLTPNITLSLKLR